MRARLGLTGDPRHRDWRHGADARPGLCVDRSVSTQRTPFDLGNRDHREDRGSCDRSAAPRIDQHPREGARISINEQNEDCRWRSACRKRWIGWLAEAESFKY